jgi:hypothetical protein
MAKQFRALSNIQHGEEGGDGSITQYVFPFGSVVEGLDKDTMKSLWDAGVLEEVDTAEPTVTKTVTTATKDGKPVNEKSDAQKAKDLKADEDAKAKAEADEKKAAADKEAEEKKAAAAANKPPAAPGNTGGSPKP